MKNKQFTQYKKLLKPMLDMATEGNLSTMQEWEIRDMVGETFIAVMHAPREALDSVKDAVRSLQGGVR